MKAFRAGYFMENMGEALDYIMGRGLVPEKSTFEDSTCSSRQALTANGGVVENGDTVVFNYGLQSNAACATQQPLPTWKVWAATAAALAVAAALLAD